WAMRRCTSAGSPFAIIHKNRPDHNETDRPDPGDDSPRIARSPKFEPSRPTRDHGKDGKGNMAEFGKYLFFNVSKRMRMRQQQRAAGRAYRGENKRRVRRTDPPGGHTPFEYRENHYKHDKQTVLEYVGNGEALPKAARSERPIFGVGAQKQE